MQQEFVLTICCTSAGDSDSSDSDDSDDSGEGQGEEGLPPEVASLARAANALEAEELRMRELMRPQHDTSLRWFLRDTVEAVVPIDGESTTR